MATVTNVAFSSIVTVMAVSIAFMDVVDSMRLVGSPHSMNRPYHDEYDDFRQHLQKTSHNKPGRRRNMMLNGPHRSNNAESHETQQPPQPSTDSITESKKRQLEEDDLAALLGEITDPEALMKLVEMTGGGDDGGKHKSPFADFTELSKSKNGADGNSTKKTSEERRVLKDFLMKSLLPRWASIVGFDGFSSSKSADGSSQSRSEEALDGDDLYSSASPSNPDNTKKASDSTSTPNDVKFQLPEAFPDFQDVVDRMQSMLGKLKQFSVKRTRQIPKISTVLPTSYWTKFMRRMRNNLGFSDDGNKGSASSASTNPESQDRDSKSKSKDSVAASSVGSNADSDYTSSQSSQKGSSINGGNKSKRKYRNRHRQHQQADAYKYQQPSTAAGSGLKLSNPYYQPTTAYAAAYAQEAGLAGGYPTAGGAVGSTGSALDSNLAAGYYTQQQATQQEQDSSPYVYHQNQDYYAYNHDDSNVANGVYYSTGLAANAGTGLDYAAAAAYYPPQPQYQTYYTFVEAPATTSDNTIYGKEADTTDSAHAWENAAAASTPLSSYGATSPSSILASDYKSASDRDQSETLATGSNKKSARANTLFDYVPSLAQLNAKEGAKYQRTWMDRAETVLANVFDVDYHVRDVQSYLDSLWGVRRLKKRSTTGESNGQTLPELGVNWQGSWLIRGDPAGSPQGKKVDFEQQEANDPCLTPGALLLECKVHDYIQDWVARNSPKLPSTFDISHVSTMADELHRTLLNKVLESSRERSEAKSMTT